MKWGAGRRKKLNNITTKPRFLYMIYIYDYISYTPVATKRRRFSKLSGDRSGPNERGAADKQCALTI